MEPAGSLLTSPKIKRWPFIALLTTGAILIHGYHPYSEDAGIYVPAIKKALDPKLYPHSAQFFLAPAHLSIFSNLLAAFVRLTHLPLAGTLLLWHAGTLALLLAACWRISDLSFRTMSAPQYGSLLVAAFLTVPIAGTSLMLADPYLTSRSISTPALVFAVCFLLEDKLLKAFLVFLCALVVHPLMAAYGGVFLLSLWAVRKRRWWVLPLLAFCVSLSVLLAVYLGRHSVFSASYQAAVLTRPYFFLSQWAWYEIFGIIAPLCLFAWVTWREKSFLEGRLGACSLAALFNGAFFLLLSLAVTRTSDQLSVARYQPMRSFHLLYVLMFLLPINLVVRKTRDYCGRVPFALFIAVTSCAMFTAQRYSFPAGPHLELPGMHSNNPWQRAFEWSRLNTPKDALFALDPDYLNAPAEDHLGFRAVSERSALADRTKDGGVVAVFPAIAPEWRSEVAEATGVQQLRTALVALSLKNAGVTWILIDAKLGKELDCPYRNDVVAVCHLPAPVQRIISPMQSISRAARGRIDRRPARF
jgi:hypothetical protein